MILKQLRRLHLATGVATVAIFLISGIAMLLMFPAAYQVNPAIRYLYRANHIYLLFAGLLNLAIGAYVAPGGTSPRRIAQLLGSLLLCLAPAILVWAFVVEPARGVPGRPLTLLGVVLCVAGTVLHLAGRQHEPLGQRASPGAKMPIGS